ncbi:MAG: threonine synthase [Synergistales bacterium]|jgi:threonine synthase|nr:threonine synthase [Synergistales bacterium]
MRGILFRYGDLLPLTKETPRLSLCEGQTPLIPLTNLGSDLAVDLCVKFEGANPTGSFKDRGMVLAVAKAIEGGAKAVVCASTGNTSAAAAAYAARANLPCFVLLPSGKVARGKLAQALIYGARVISVRGNFDRALDLARQASEELGLAIVNSVNPYRLLGQQSAAWEICDELGEAPDRLVIPVGNAGNISAYWAGFNRYRELGRTRNLPQMIGVQASGASPLVEGHPFDKPETVATAIRIGRPVNAEKAKTAVRESGGRFLAVSDEEILAAQRLLASREGIFAEPASCASLAGLLRLHREERLPEGIRIVAVLTGNGLKDPDAALNQVPEMVEIDDRWESLREVLAR